MLNKSKVAWFAGILIVLLAVGATAADRRRVERKVETDSHGRSGAPAIGRWEWTDVNPGAMWEPRAGHQVVELHNRFYLIGGRSPLPPPAPFGASEIYGDVWESEDLGASWTRLLDTGDADWPARAYFGAVRKGGEIFIMGGQNFILVPNDCGDPPPPGCPPFVTASDFFTDVWSSADGVNWRKRTADAGWEGRAGISVLVFKGQLWLFGGSQFDDDAVGGPGGPARIYFNDVWSSYDGVRWVEKLAEAPWEPRAGAAVVAKNGFMYLLGGEDGFVCQPVPCEPPYFNDVWRTRDGVHWELVTASAGWSSRPGHKCAVILNEIVCMGGFGLSQDPADPFAPANPMDVWVSGDGADWRQVSDAPWEAQGPEDIKYDFAILPVRGRGLRPAIYTFGGDRETFNPFDPLNYLNIDNDVWRYAPAMSE